MVAQDVKQSLEELHPASFAWSLVCCHGNYPEAEEVLQAAYLKVLERRARFSGRSSFKTWFFSVVRTTALERRRRRRVRHALLIGWARSEPSTETAPDPHADAARTQRSARILRALTCLSSRQRQVLELVFYQDLTLAQAATVLRLSLGAVRTHYARGKKNLSAALARGGADD